MCSFRSCQTRFEFLSQFRKVRNAFECFITQVQTRLPKTKCVWPMKINVICTVRPGRLSDHQTQRVTTRGNNKKIFKTRARTKIRSHQFTNRTVEAWNKLPDSIIGAGTVGTFQRRLDIFWRDHEVLFDCDQQLETSSRNSGHRNVPSDSDTDLDI